MVNDSAVVVFDDERAVANAGVMLPAVLAGRLGIVALVDECVDLGDRPGAANPGRKVMSLVSAMALGADCIEDCDIPRSGQTGAVLGHRVAARRRWGRSRAPSRSVMSASSIGCSPLRSGGHGRQAPGRAMIASSWTSTRSLLRSTAMPKQGAGIGYTPQARFHPILATREGTGEVLHVRLREGQASSTRGALRFVEDSSRGPLEPAS